MTQKTRKDNAILVTSEKLRIVEQEKRDWNLALQILAKLTETALIMVGIFSDGHTKGSSLSAAPCPPSTLLIIGNTRWDIQVYDGLKFTQINPHFHGGSTTNQIDFIFRKFLFDLLS